MNQAKNLASTRPVINGIHTLLLHHNPHIEEIVAVFLCQRTPEGKEKFPGIEKAGIGFSTMKYLKERGLTGDEGNEQLIQKGYLAIGTGRGMFDEHVKKSDCSAARLVADYIGISDDKIRRKIFSNILGYVDYEDRHGDRPELLHGETPDDMKLKQFAHAFLPGTLVKKAWRVIDPKDSEGQSRMIEIIFTLLQHEVADQESFHVAAAEEYHSNHKVVTVGEGMALIVIHSDHPRVSAYARFSFKGRANEKSIAILQIQKSGTFQIFPGMNGENGNRRPFNLGKVARNLRKKLAERKGLTFDWSTNIGYQDGEVAGLEEIYYQQEAQHIFNSSLTQPDVQPLIPKFLNEKDIIHAIEFGMAGQLVAQQTLMSQRLQTAK